jgi:IS1 family transposase
MREPERQTKRNDQERAAAVSLPRLSSLIERFNLTLRNWCVNLNRKTLAVSQSIPFHRIRIRLVLNHYNSLHAGLW